MKLLHHPAKDEIALPTVLHALSDPVRLQIVAQIHKNGEQACKNFEVSIAKSTLSQHARTLREAGITHTRAVGTHRLLSLRTEDLNARFPGLLDAVLSSYKSNTNPVRQTTL
ncbi:helix-turn-helix transcriptional regulator [Saccharibacillus sacchari]|uniref:Helix-turn-helix transcriptional regulator n=1 Tax=Saccharibacillus sacchari TaxID=456493 RepID=A0ACC6PE16_9BACL